MSTARTYVSTASKPINLDLAAQIFGKTGEVKIGSTDSDLKFCDGIYADGIYQRRNTDVGSFVYKKHDINFPYLDEKGSTDFEYKLPKPPVGMLNGIAKFFRDIMAKMDNSEVMVQIWWDKSTEKYELYVPVQRVAGASIKFDHSAELSNDANKIWVVDIHSHNTMGAFFSGTDSADEVSTRVFGVLGQLNRDEFASVWRAGVNGKFHSLTVEDLWDESNTDITPWIIDPKEVEDKVTKIVYQVQTRSVPANSKTVAKGGGISWVGNRKANKLGKGGRQTDYGHQTSHGQYHGYSGYQGYGDDFFDGYYSDMYGDDRTDQDRYMSNIKHAASAYPTLASEALDDNMIQELIVMTDHLEQVTQSNELGMCGHTELNETVKAFVDFFSDFDAFDKSTAQTIIDSLSGHLKKADFDDVMTIYSE